MAREIWLELEPELWSKHLERNQTPYLSGRDNFRLKRAPTYTSIMGRS